MAICAENRHRPTNKSPINALLIRYLLNIIKVQLEYPYVLKKEFILSNWNNFDVFTLDFGRVSLYLFTVAGTASLPFLSSIYQGVNDQNTIYLVALLLSVDKKSQTNNRLTKLHQYWRLNRPNNNLNDFSRFF